MSLQQTKTYNKEESLAKQASDEASRNAAEAQKKSATKKADAVGAKAQSEQSKANGSND